MVWGAVYENVPCVNVVGITACARKLDPCVGKREIGGSPSWDAKSGSFVAKPFCWLWHAWGAHSIGLGCLSSCIAWLVAVWNDFTWSTMSGWSVMVDWLAAVCDWQWLLNVAAWAGWSNCVKRGELGWLETVTVAQLVNCGDRCIDTGDLCSSNNICNNSDWLFVVGKGCCWWLDSLMDEK